RPPKYRRLGRGARGTRRTRRVACWLWWTASARRQRDRAGSFELGNHQGSKRARELVRWTTVKSNFSRRCVLRHESRWVQGHSAGKLSVGDRPKENHCAGHTAIRKL